MNLIGNLFQFFKGNKLNLSRVGKALILGLSPTINIDTLLLQGRVTKEELGSILVYSIGNNANRTTYSRVVGDIYANLIYRV